MKLLSICVPTFNREKELGVFFESIPEACKEDIEIVIVDDGSTDGSADLINDFIIQGFDIKYIYQENSGRSIALKKAIMHASSVFCILMDSDDYFESGGIESIMLSIKKFESESALIFGTKLINGEAVRTNIPPTGEYNFISLRADFGVKHDLKEVVRTNVLQSVMYNVPTGCRRVPTSLLWSKVALNFSVRGIQDIVAVKEYLPGGMSDRILSLKSKNPEPLVELYELLSSTTTYKSIAFRVRSMILWARYSFHARDVKVDKIWKFLVLPFGLSIYFIDKFKLWKK